GWLPAFAIIASLLTVADRRAEDHAVLRRHGKKGDLAVELDELLDDHTRAVAPHIRDRIVPGLADLLGILCSALAVARARHHRLDYAGEADLVSRKKRFLAALGKPVSGGDEAKLVCREIADSVAVHRQLHRPRRRRDVPAFLFELGKRRR